jgi:hypothetical protein
LVAFCLERTKEHHIKMMEQSFDLQTLFPYVTHGDVKNPALVLLNDFSQCYSTKFIDLLSKDYYVIVMEFPKMTQRIISDKGRSHPGKKEALIPDSLSSILGGAASDPRYGFTFLELMDSFYQTLTKLQLLDDINESTNSEGKKTPTEVKEEVQERLRRLSVIEEFKEPEPLREISLEGSEVTSVDGSSDEKEEMEESVKVKHETVNVSPPSIVTPVKKSGLISDDSMDKENLPDNTTSPVNRRDLFERTPTSRTLSANKATPPVNVFNVEDVKATNEQIQRKANSRRNSISSPTRISRENSRRDSRAASGGWKEEPEIEPELGNSPTDETKEVNKDKDINEEEETEISPHILDHIIEKEEEMKQIPTNRHLKGIITQSYFASYFLFLYKKQFPSHISTLICLQYGIKNVFYFSDILTTFLYEWICCGFFLFSVSLASVSSLIGISVVSKFLIQCIFFCFHCLLVLFAIVMEMVVFLVYFPQLVISLKVREDGKQRLCRFSLWIQTMLWYNCSIDNCFLYYQLWKKRVSGHPSVYQLIFPEQCRLLFLVRVIYSLFLTLSLLYSFFSSTFASFLCLFLVFNIFSSLCVSSISLV